MNLSFKASLLALAVSPLASVADAGVFTSIVLTDDFAVDSAVSVNAGGLDGPAVVDPVTGASTNPTLDFGNGAAELNFLRTIDDSANSGAIFDVVITATGRRAGGAGVAEVRAGGSGATFFGGGANNRQIDFNVTSITETTATGATLEFLGLSAATFTGLTSTNDNFLLGADVANGGVLIANADPAVDPTVVNNTLSEFTFGIGGTGTALQADGSVTFQRSTGGATLASTTFEFEVSGGAVIPEPASMSLLALGAVGLLSRRRRNA